MFVRVADPVVNEGGMSSLSVNDTRPKISWLMNQIAGVLGYMIGLGSDDLSVVSGIRIW